MAAFGKMRDGKAGFLTGSFSTNPLAATAFAAAMATVGCGLFASMLAFGRWAAFQRGVVIAVTEITDPDGSP
ncbi:hypothetical protein [Paracoccus hibiscisoli]|uniref:Uncharacterized protein n=1 Tax=Paracoccus hibiscisoli TaxID=2023261 RepID=A0A4U0QU19_9RHOB|nr:hypothetical protein [Paracoccus hibiscisoli]TJZ85603.1 hypothetical protein FA740_06890 [Paracoccus hibiscisoli]